MAKGNKIIVEGNGGIGHREWGVIGDTSKPGTVMNMDPTAAQQGGRWKWKATTCPTAGNMVPHAILLEDCLQGFLTDVAYVSGTMGELYWPVRGENMNILSTETSGTGQSFVVGKNMIIATSGGKIIPTTGSPMEYFCQSLEAIHEPGDYLLWCMMY